MLWVTVFCHRIVIPTKTESKTGRLQRYGKNYCLFLTNSNRTYRVTDIKKRLVVVSMSMEVQQMHSSGSDLLLLGSPR